MGAASGVLNIISDFTMFILPLPTIHRLQMSTAKKLRVYGCFSLGLLACVTSVVRLVYSIKLLHVPSHNPEYLLIIDITGLWRYTDHPSQLRGDQLTRSSFAEIAIGIIAGCLPSLPRFFQQFSHKETTSLYITRRNTTTGFTRKSWRKYLPWSSRTRTNGDSGRFTHGTRAPRLATLNLPPFTVHELDHDGFERPAPIRGKSAPLEDIELQPASPSWSSYRQGRSQQPYGGFGAVGRAA